LHEVKASDEARGPHRNHFRKRLLSSETKHRLVTIRIRRGSRSRKNEIAFRRKALGQEFVVTVSRRRILFFFVGIGFVVLVKEVVEIRLVKLVLSNIVNDRQSQDAAVGFVSPSYQVSHTVVRQIVAPFGFFIAG
jgi:hypothetical protein